jgi:hypothetical protein
MRSKPDELRKDAQKSNDPNAPSFAKLISDDIQKQMDVLDSRDWALPFDIKKKVKEAMGTVYKVAKVIKDNGDGLVGCDPTGYAKAAWLPFCIILNVSRATSKWHLKSC